MRIFGISLTTVLLVLIAVFVTRKWGNMMPVIKDM